MLIEGNRLWALELGQGELGAGEGVIVRERTSVDPWDLIKDIWWRGMEKVS